MPTYLLSCSSDPGLPLCNQMRGDTDGEREREGSRIRIRDRASCKHFSDDWQNRSWNERFRRWAFPTRLDITIPLLLLNGLASPPPPRVSNQGKRERERIKMEGKQNPPQQTWKLLCVSGQLAGVDEREESSLLRLVFLEGLRNPELSWWRRREEKRRRSRIESCRMTPDHRTRKRRRRRRNRASARRLATCLSLPLPLTQPGREGGNSGSRGGVHTYTGAAAPSSSGIKAFSGALQATVPF